jgi:hypothetical protein
MALTITVFVLVAQAAKAQEVDASLSGTGGTTADTRAESPAVSLAAESDVCMLWRSRSRRFIHLDRHNLRCRVYRACWPSLPP